MRVFEFLGSIIGCLVRAFLFGLGGTFGIMVAFKLFVCFFGIPFSVF